jgi:hypothetical protein
VSRCGRGTNCAQHHLAAISPRDLRRAQLGSGSHQGSSARPGLRYMAPRHTNQFGQSASHLRALAYQIGIGMVAYCRSLCFAPTGRMLPNSGPRIRICRSIVCPWAPMICSVSVGSAQDFPTDTCHGDRPRVDKQFSKRKNKISPMWHRLLAATW